MVVASLETVKLVTDIVAGAATVVAIAVGGFWALWAFGWERKRWPRGVLSLEVTHHVLTATRTHVQVKVLLQNVGSARITASQLQVHLIVISPLKERECGEIEAMPMWEDVSRARGDGEDEAKTIWSELPGPKAVRSWEAGKGPQIEAGETDELCFDFLIPPEIETVRVYAHLKNEKHRGRDFGWHASGFFDLPGAEKEFKIRWSDEGEVGVGEIGPIRFGPGRPTPGVRNQQEVETGPRHPWPESPKPKGPAGA